MLYLRNLRSGCLGLLATLILASGCNDMGAEVTGKVTFKGQPLRAGRVTFHHPDRPGRNVIATIREDGTYHAYAVPVGQVKVTVQPLPPRSKGSPRGQLHTGVKKADRVPPVPVQYTDPATTDLICPVRRGTQIFDIEL